MLALKAKATGAETSALLVEYLKKVNNSREIMAIVIMQSPLLFRKISLME